MDVLKPGTRVSFTDGIQLDQGMRPTGQRVKCSGDHPCYGTVVGMAKRRGVDIGYIIRTEFQDYAQVEMEGVTEVKPK